MMNRSYKLMAIFGVLAAVGGNALAVTVQVGNCRMGIASFPNIQSAVNAVPDGGTVLVCPGDYPEQVVINKDLTLRGVQSGASGAAVIVAPAGGIMQNTTSLTTGNPIAAQVLVTEAGDVDIRNLTIDGGNNQINACSPTLVGLYYQNASGSVSHAVVANQALVAAENGCQSGLAIFAQSGKGGSSRVTVSDSHIAGFQKNGITGNEPGTSIDIIGNTVIGQGPSTAILENSIQVAFGAIGRIVSNAVADDSASGILVIGSEGVVVSDNTISNTQLGIAFISDPSGAADNGTVTRNQISATHIFDGIELCSNGNRVRDNVVNGSDEAGVHIDSSCGAVARNRVSENHINGACAGILVGTGAGANDITGNAFSNVRNTVLASDLCALPVATARSTNNQETTPGSSLRLGPARP